MKKKPNPNPLRLRKKHGEGRGLDVTVADGERLVRAQSVRNAVISAFVVLAMFCVVWISLSSLTNRVFPWMTVVFGAVLGLVIRRTGRGVDWRFPALAAFIALIGSVVSNFVLAASTTADDYGIGTIETLGAVTSMTCRYFLMRCGMWRTVSSPSSRQALPHFLPIAA